MNGSKEKLFDRLKISGRKCLRLRHGTRRARTRRTNPGYTLIELMISIAICGTLGAIAIPQYSTFKNRAHVAVAISDIKNIGKVIALYNLENNQYPETLADINMQNKLDPWGQPYVYLRIEGAANPGKGVLRKDHSMVPVNSDFDLYSVGPDGMSVAPFTAEASKDDIVRANNGRYIGLVSNY
jgi:general secretion pathway protein G